MSVQKILKFFFFCFHLFFLPAGFQFKHIINWKAIQSNNYNLFFCISEWRRLVFLKSNANLCLSPPSSCIIFIEFTIYCK